MDGRILNSEGQRVAEIRGQEIYGLVGKKLYDLRGQKIYKPTGEGRFNTLAGDGRLDKFTGRLFQNT